jgi:hypothetical protein
MIPLLTHVSFRCTVPLFLILYENELRITEEYEVEGVTTYKLHNEM